MIIFLQGKEVLLEEIFPTVFIYTHGLSIHK